MNVDIRCLRMLNPERKQYSVCSGNLSMRLQAVNVGSVNLGFRISHLLETRRCVLGVNSDSRRAGHYCTMCPANETANYSNDDTWFPCKQALAWHIMPCYYCISLENLVGSECLQSFLYSMPMCLCVLISVYFFIIFQIYLNFLHQYNEPLTNKMCFLGILFLS